MRKSLFFRKSIAGIFAILLLMLTIFPSIYITAESEHECEGEECPICHIIEICEGILHDAGSALSFCAAVAFMCSVFEFLPFFKSKISFGRTLFDLKVRLND